MGIEMCFLLFFLIVVGCFYGLLPLRCAIYPFMVGLFFFCLMCCQKQSQLLRVTRSTYSKYRLQFVELCVHIHLLCISLSIFGKYRAKNFVSDISVILLQPRTLSTLHKLDVVASLSILAAHLAGHHDICDRIYKRLLSHARALRTPAQWLREFSYQMLEEIPSDLEDQSNRRLGPVEVPTKTCNLSFSVTQCRKEESPASSNETVAKSRDAEAMNEILDDEVTRGPPQIKRVSSTYTYIGKELHSIKARMRWSSVRYALGFQKHPLEEFSFLVAVPRQAFPHNSRFEGYSNSHSVFQLSSGDKMMARRPSTSITSSVHDMIEYNDALGIEQTQPYEFGSSVTSTTYSDHDELPPCMQLPGIIQTTPIKALPDTGSSQNIIDASFVQSLNPPVRVRPVDPTSDKPLLAPDGVEIPCEGKVYLLWVFKNETHTYNICFYVVKNCSHNVIIGNGFLRETETFEEHQDRLEITERCDPDRFPGNLVSAAKVVPYQRQIVSGTVNSRPVKASLDTGCEANLMSEEYAEERGLTITPLPAGNQEVKFTNGRRGSTLGQVVVWWSFADSPILSRKVKCYVLPKCIHPIILGVHFVISESPWQKHKSTLSWEELPHTGDAGVVDLRKAWLSFGKYKPSEPSEAGSFRYVTNGITIDPQTEQVRKDNEAEHRRLEAMLLTRSSPLTAPSSAAPTSSSPGANTPQPGAAAMGPQQMVTSAHANGTNLVTLPTAVVATTLTLTPSSTTLTAPPTPVIPPSTSSSGAALLPSSVIPSSQTMVTSSVPSVP